MQGDYMYYFYPTLNQEDSNEEIRRKFSDMKKERYECNDTLILRMVVLMEQPGVFSVDGNQIEGYEAQ